MSSIAFDLDGTLVTYDRPKVFGQPVPVGVWLEGSRELLRRLLDLGHRVVVHSCRATWPAGGGWQSIAELLAGAGFRPHLVTDGPGSLRDDIKRAEVWHELFEYSDRALEVAHETYRTAYPVGIWLGHGKPIAAVYVDDCGFHFPGVWTLELTKALEALL